MTLALLDDLNPESDKVLDLNLFQGC